MSKFDLPKKFDYKNTDLLKQFITETGKIMPARVTGITASNQRKVTKSVKIARFLALLPITWTKICCDSSAKTALRSQPKTQVSKIRALLSSK